MNNQAKFLLIIKSDYNNNKNTSISYIIFKLNYSYYLYILYNKNFNFYFELKL